jgi:hypothetical protein
MNKTGALSSNRDYYSSNTSLCLPQKAYYFSRWCHTLHSTVSSIQRCQNESGFSGIYTYPAKTLTSYRLLAYARIVMRSAAHITGFQRCNDVKYATIGCNSMTSRYRRSALCGWQRSVGQTRCNLKFDLRKLLHCHIVSSSIYTFQGLALKQRLKQSSARDCCVTRKRSHGSLNRGRAIDEVLLL